MTDERTEVRAVLEAVAADPPPTRLTVDGICAAARRSRWWAGLPALLRRLPMRRPSAPGPSAPGPSVPRPSVPRPSVPGPSVPGPSVPGPSVPRPSRRLAGRVATVAAVVAAVALLPGLVLLAVLTGGGGVSTSGGGMANAPPPTAVGVQVAGIVELATDRRTLTVQVTTGGCTGPVRLHLAERENAVVLTATPGPGAVALGTRCAGTASPVTLTAEMARPLGARQLIDGSTGLALLVLDESAVARVTYAPAGYRPGGACRPPSAVGGSRPTVPECTTVLAPARPGGRLSPVSVTQIFGSRPTQRAGPVWGPPTLLQVHRLPAQLRLGHLAGAHAGQPQYTRVLLWTEHGVNVTVSSGPAASPDRLPSAAELLRVADGVRW